MKRLSITMTGLLLVLLTTFTGCELVEGIFKAGFWTAIILVIIVVAIIVWLLRKGKD